MTQVITNNLSKPQEHVPSGEVRVVQMHAIPHTSKVFFTLVDVMSPSGPWGFNDSSPEVTR